MTGGQRHTDHVQSDEITKRGPPAPKGGVFLETIKGASKGCNERINHKENIRKSKSYVMTCSVALSANDKTVVRRC